MKPRLNRGRKRTIEIERPATTSGAGRVVYRLDGKPLEADVIEVATGVYSILLGGRALEVRVQPAEGTGGLRVHVAGEELAAQVFDPRSWRGWRAPPSRPKAASRSSCRCRARSCVLVRHGDRSGRAGCSSSKPKMQNETAAKVRQD
jgi:hypothetical protein